MCFEQDALGKKRNPTLTNLRGMLGGVLICIFLVINDIKHLYYFDPRSFPSVLSLLPSLSLILNIIFKIN